MMRSSVQFVQPIRCGFVGASHHLVEIAVEPDAGCHQVHEPDVGVVSTTCTPPNSAPLESARPGAGRGPAGQSRVCRARPGGRRRARRQLRRVAMAWTPR